MPDPLPDAVAIADAIRSRQVSALDVARAALDRIKADDAGVNAFTVVLADEALQVARSVDRGEITGPLAGVPIAVKDHIWLRGAPATNGSRALADFVPTVDNRAVTRLRQAGAVIVGKTNNPEFCYRGTTANDLWGVTANPRDPSRTAGGSSGGSGAAVAAGMVPLALGTDGGGSIRIPAAFCGVAGLKPSHDLVPSLPGFRGWPSLSVVGPLSTSVRALILAMQVLTGASPPGAGAATAPDLGGLRIAAATDLGFAAVDPDVRAAVDAAIGEVAASHPVAAAVPDPVDPVPLWDAVALPEGWASEGPLLAVRPDLVGADAAAIVRAGEVALADYLDAREEQRRFADRWDAFFDDWDVLLAAAMPVTAFPLDQLAPVAIDGRPVPQDFDGWCALALPANLAGLPAACIPVGTGADGLPVGLQIIGRRGGDATVLRAAAAIERLLAGRVR